jgi:phage terminase Nu1 subunit (DNA packaging protein)
MEIIGFSGLQAAFGGTIATWKARVKEGLPVTYEPGLRSGKARKFDSVSVFQWLVSHESATPGNGLLDRNQEQARLYRTQEKRQALALARETGALIPGEIVERVWSGMTNAAKQRLLALPTRIAAECAGQSFAIIEARAQELVWNALDEIGDYRVEDYLEHPEDA